MKVCNCMLPYINPNACKNCNNNFQDYSDFTYQPYEEIKIDFPKKRIIKEYDKEGKLVKEIIEEI